MNNKQKNSLEFTEPVIEQNSDNFVLEVMQEKISDDVAAKYVLIKHDYYSSDSDHGRDLLRSFFNVLVHSDIKNLIIYLTDSGTRLLDENNPLHNDFYPLIGKSEIVIADDESITNYEVSCSTDSKLSIKSFDSIAEDIIFGSDFLILE